MSSADIKSMKLYAHLERIRNELTAAGIDPDGSLTVAQLSPIDNLHYHGTDAVERAITDLGLTAESRVADIGSGLGGPARYIADRTGCHVTALELQPDQNDLAQELTRRCGLADKVAHVCGDVLDGPLDKGGFDAVVSWLAFYHITDHRVLFARLAAALKPGGMIYIEDLTNRGAYGDDELRLFKVKIYGQARPSQDAYVAELRTAGFTDIQTEDLTDDWAAFTNERLTAYRADRERHLDVHGPAIVAELEDFYDAVDRLFSSGKLGGLRVLARKS